MFIVCLNGDVISAITHNAIAHIPAHLAGFYYNLPLACIHIHSH